MVNATLAYDVPTIADISGQIFLRGTNLLDEGAEPRLISHLAPRVGATSWWASAPTSALTLLPPLSRGVGANVAADIEGHAHDRPAPRAWETPPPGRLSCAWSTVWRCRCWPDCCRFRVRPVRRASWIH